MLTLQHEAEEDTPLRQAETRRRPPGVSVARVGRILGVFTSAGILVAFALIVGDDIERGVTLEAYDANGPIDLDAGLMPEECAA